MATMVNQDQSKSITPPIPAGARVAGIVELLEQILLELVETETWEAHDSNAEIGRRTILIAQRVSRAFLETIAGSSSLQKALFFTPPDEELWNTNYTINPLLATTLRSSESITFAPTTILEHRSNGVYVWLNGILSSIPVHGDRSGKEASWRKMYLYGGSYHVGNIYMSRGEGSERMRTSMAANLENPTMGKIVDIALPENFGELGLRWWHYPDFRW